MAAQSFPAPKEQGSGKAPHHLCVLPTLTDCKGLVKQSGLKFLCCSESSHSCPAGHILFILLSNHWALPFSSL